MGISETDSFTVHCAAGQYVHLTAERQGVELSIKVLAPSGALVVQADTPRGAFGTESVSFEATAEGEWRIQAAGLGSSHGPYRLELSEPRAATNEDRRRIHAEADRNLASERMRRQEKASSSEAVRLFSQAAVEWRDLREEDERAVSLEGQAVSLLLLGQARETLEIAGRALALFRSLKDRAGEAQALHSIGVATAALGDNAKALEHLGAALDIETALGDRAAEAETLNQRGLTYSALADQAKAMADLERSLAARNAGDNKAGAAITQASVGLVYTAAGDNTRAKASLEAALPVLESAGERVSLALALDGLASASSALGYKKKAVELYNRAIELERSIGNPDSEAATLANLGVISDETGQPEKAIEYLTQALALARSAGDRYLEANTLQSIGAAYADEGQRRKSIEFFNQAIPALEALGDRAGKAMALSNRGLNYSNLGEHEKALQSLEEALALQKQTDDKPGQAQSLVAMGNVYNNLGELDKAIDYYEQAGKLFTELKSPRGQGEALGNAGLVYYKRKEYQKALDYYGRALPLLKSVQDGNSEGAMLENMANAFRDLGHEQKTQAMDAAERALSVNRAARDRGHEALTLATIGYTARDLGDRRKAMASLEEALPIFREVGDRTGEAAALAGLARIFRDRLMDDTAVCFLKEAVNLTQSIRRDNGGLPDDLKRTYSRSVEPIYRELAGVLVEQERFGEAEEVLNLLKERETLSYLERDAMADQLRSLSLSAGEKRALENYDRLQEKIVPLGRRFAALLAKQRSPEEEVERSQISKSLADANLLLERYFNEVQKTASARTREIREATGLQSDLLRLGPDVAAIYTLVLPDRYVAELITGSARRVYITRISQAELDRKIFAFREQLQIPSSNPTAQARELYHIVFPEGLRQDLDNAHVGTIMWSMDSTLRYIPVAALHDGNTYLVTRFRNSLITPASISRRRLSPAPQWKGAGFGVSKSKSKEFADLPAVPEELNRIFRTEETGPAPVRGSVMLDLQFTPETFEKTLRDQSRQVVHIATHFQSRPGVAANSRLLFGDGSQLTLAELGAMPLLFDGVDLLTLSACNTAFTNSRMHEEDGREVDSFGTIAQQSGARSVVASLWGAHDVSTARLMEAMYRLRQADPSAGKSEALRLAQQQMAEGLLRPEPASGPADWKHPYYWAAFILIGNWR